MNYAYWGVEYLWCLSDIIVYYLFMKQVLGLRKNANKNVYIFIGVAISVIIFIATYSSLLSTAKSVLFIITLFLYTLLFDGSIINKIFYNIIYNLVMVTIEIIVINMLVYFFKTSMEDLIINVGVSRIILGFITKLLFYIVLIIISNNILKINIIFPKKYVYLMFSIFIISALSLAVIFDIGLLIGKSEEISILLIALCFGFIFIDLVIYFFMIKLSKYFIVYTKTKIIQTQDKETDKYFKLQESSYLQIRKMCHDVNNHLINIQNLIKNNNAKEAQDYITTVCNDINIIPMEIKTGNEIADIVLNQKNFEAKKNNININVKAFVPPDLSIKSNDLSSVLFNSIDNAIEASLKLEDIALRTIDINIFPKKNYLFFEIKNTINSNLLSKNKIFETTKNDILLSGSK